MRILLISIFFISVHIIYGQNLVPNPGFEEYAKCPTKISQLNRTAYWTSPTKGTPDYYCSCADKSKDSLVGVPANRMGNQQAHTGDAYAGIILYNDFDPYDEREYL